MGTTVKSVTKIDTVLDIDAPSGGIPPKIDPPDGIPAHAGWLPETFENDFDASSSPGTDLSPQLRGTPGFHNDTIGVTVSTQPGGINVLSAVGCGGFQVPPQDIGCRIDPDNDMDWHIHCPTTGAGTCANIPGQVTPAGGNLSYQGTNSLHWGHHFDPTSRDGDSTKFRQLAAFMTRPLPLTPLPVPGDLELSFFQIASMMDNNYFNALPGQAVDFGDVQIQVDQNADPNVDDWGFWDKLVPFQNTYDHIAYIWSTFGTSPTYCLLTPTDTGVAPPNPRGVHETLCYPLGVWSHCGNVWTKATIYQCDGPGLDGVAGVDHSLWVQSKFSLAAFVGQNVRIRWLAQSWEFDQTDSSYVELGSWNAIQGDDGWWIDDILITGVITSQSVAPADAKTPGPGALSCPSQTCNSGLGDKGFTVDLLVRNSTNQGAYICSGGTSPGRECSTDLQCGTGGTCAMNQAARFTSGEKVSLSAAGTSNIGGCVGGGPQFRFLKDGVQMQDWSSNPLFIDTPVRDATYRVQARCSVDLTCVSVDAVTAANSKSIQLYSGDGDDVTLNLTHVRATNTTTVGWISRFQAPQIPQVLNYSVFTGLINSSGDANLNTLSGAACLGPLAARTQPAAGAGQPMSVDEVSVPALGAARYYLAGQNPTAVGPAGVMVGHQLVLQTGVLTPKLRPVLTACP